MDSGYEKKCTYPRAFQEITSTRLGENLDLEVREKRGKARLLDVGLLKVSGWEDNF